MRKVSIHILRAVVILLGFFVFVFLLWEPNVEGRNANSTLFQVYFKDPFLVYVYIGSIAFFTGLYQTFKLLGHIGKNQIFSQASLYTLRKVRVCSLTLISFLLGAEFYFFIFQKSTQEDIAGGVVIGSVLIFLLVVITAALIVFESTLQKALEIKSENDLTV